ncbi:MAG TPA: MFS transporter [Roseiflexaceae bacterium]|nr:MFS transporter [Roseiflexaceae bacterium]
MMSQQSSTRALSADFWKFWGGQTISNLGTSFTAFALPLLIYKLTGSAMNLAFSTAANFLPYLLFGLVIGAWVDRVDRKRLMIAVDIANALIIASIPALAMFDMLSVWWIYGVGFISSTLGIAFQSAEFAAIPSLVTNNDDLVSANGRIQASYSAAAVVGPLLAGLLTAIMPLYDVLFFDAASFVVSALALAAIRRSFNAASEQTSASIRKDVVEGLRYVLGHSVLRNISLMMALVNFVGATSAAQLVLFAQRRLAANDFQIGLLYSAGSIGVVLLSLMAGVLRKRWPFSRVALGALMLEGLLTVGLSLTTWYWVGLLLWALISGLGILFNINTGSLRQAIVPNHMLGRVMSIAGVLAWSAIPIGTLLGGALIEATDNVALVYGAIGVLTFVIPLAFSFTALGRAERYLPQAEAPIGEAVAV